MNSDLRALGDGTIGGCLGTIAMSVVMVGGKRQVSDRTGAAGGVGLGESRGRGG